MADHLSDAPDTGVRPQAAPRDLHAETIDTVEPLNRRAPPDAYVPEALRTVLFDQPDASVHLNTYAILDAAKIFGLDTEIAGSGLEYRCLFSGAAREALGEVAPWLVAIAPDAQFTRNVFSHDPATDVHWFYWSREPGLFLRSAAGIDDLRAHFRKFTRVQDERLKWYYFRFWEPRWTPLLLADMTPKDRSAFFGPVERFIAPRCNGPCTVLSLRPAREAAA